VPTGTGCIPNPHAPDTIATVTVCALQGDPTHGKKIH
jgi:hypothetical protein